MTDLLRHGSQWLEQQRLAFCSSPVTYRRPSADGPAEELEVAATFGRTTYEVQDDYGLRVQASVMDFLIAADALAVSFGRPQPGDEIVAPSTGSGQGDGATFEVLPLAGENCWRWSDPFRTTLRIHTKET